MPVPPSHPNRSSFGPAAISFLLAVAVYAITLRGGWIYDDTFAALEDPRLHDPHQWAKYLREGYVPDGADHLWRPLTSLSFAIQWQLHGGRGWAFHAVNVLLHATASAMVALLTARLLTRRAVGLSTASVLPTSSTVAACAAGALFAVHPIHVDAVAWLVGRAESMATIGILGGLLLFARRPLRIGKAMGIAACFAGALFSKEQGLLLPLMLIAWAVIAKLLGEDRAGIRIEPEAFPNAVRLEHAPRIPRVTPWLLVFMLGLTAAYLRYRDSILPLFWESGILDPVINPVAFANGSDRWLLPVAILGRYAQLLVAPLKLSIDYSAGVFTTHQSFRDPYLYAGLATVAIYALALLVALLRRSGVAALCLIWAGMGYLLVGNWMLVGTVFGERLMYLPSAFLCVLAGWGLARLRPRPRYALLIALLAAGSIRTVTYARHWSDTTHFYEYALREQPRSAMLYILLANRYDQFHDPRADAVLAEARKNCPDCWNVWVMSAEHALQQDRLDEADEMALKGFTLRKGVMSAVSVLNRVDERRAALAATRPATVPSTAPGTGMGAAQQ